MSFNTTFKNGNKFNSIKGNDRRNMFCNYCQKPGHTVEKCFKLLGYPANFKSTKPRTFQNQHIVQGNSAITEDENYNIMGNPTGYTGNH